MNRRSTLQWMIASAGAVVAGGRVFAQAPSQSPGAAPAGPAHDPHAPLLVTSAMNGSSKTKKDHPALPIAADEIGHAAAACAESGAAMLHLHVRDAEGKHTLDPDAYRAAIAAVRKESGDRLVIQTTTEATGIFKPEQQMAMVRTVKPEAASFAMKELAPDEKAIPAAAEFLAWTARERILPQYILYSPQEVDAYRKFLERGVIPHAPHQVLFVLGRYTPGQVSAPADMLPFHAAMGTDTAPFSVTAFGKQECACVLTSAALGGHARVGFENNLYLADGSLAPDNAALVRQVKIGASLLGRPLMTSDQLRKTFRG
jgi:uncharacterized protein (DUF849 family)